MIPGYGYGNGRLIIGPLVAAVLMAVAWGAAADRLTDRIGEVCAQAVAAEFRNRGRADHFEDHGSAFGARIYVNNRDFFNCHVSKDFRHYTLFDMTGKQVARGNSAGGDDRGYPTAGPDGDDLLESLLGIRRDDGRHDDRRQDGRFAERGFSRGEIVVYEHRGFRGSSRQFHGEMRNLGQTGLNDAISSVHILSGVWEFCSDADYRGRCILLDRDENDLADHGLGDRVSSFRPVRR